MSDDLTNRDSDAGPAIHAERVPVSNPPRREGGPDACLGGSKLPHVGERWRHLRTGVIAEVTYRYEDAVLVATDNPNVWPIDLFCAKWVRA
jgi:hypothetical protein